jgi:hypothetical protein
MDHGIARSMDVFSSHVSRKARFGRIPAEHSIFKVGLRRLRRSG